MTYLRPWEPLVGPEHVVKGDLLVLAPHPDDEVIGCGGLIAAHRELGHAVSVVVMTDGGKGDPTGGFGGASYSDLRRGEAREAARRIGGAEIEFLRHPDGGLAASADAVEDLLRILDARRPATVAFPSPFEVHPDHRATALHLASAWPRLAARPALLAYEIGGFMPANLLLDVTRFAERKADAIRAYSSQLAHMDIPAKVGALNLARTVNIADAGVKACEAYCLVRSDRLAAYMAAAEATVRLVDGMGPFAG